MQNLLTKASELHEKKEGPRPAISLWSRSGPALLLGAFAIFLFKCAPFYWPLVLTAFLGYATIRLLRKSGLLFSLIALCGASVYIFRSGHEPLWTTLLAASIAVSWLLIYLGGLDIEALAFSREDRIQSLEAELLRLEKQLREKNGALSEQQRQSLNEKQSLSASLAQERQALEISENEREKLREKCEILSQHIQVHLEKENASQQALENAQNQLAELKKQCDELAAQRVERIEIEETSTDDTLASGTGPVSIGPAPRAIRREVRCA